ncbi:MAG: DUF1579 domain-containing protein [Phycisphaerales bacterium]|nr:DUF1579 domain-containing protein [Phycisphaerales bacterium]
MEALQVTDQHRWLHKFLGDWQYEATCPGGPDGGEMSFKGTEHVRMIGDAWIHGVGKTEVGGEEHEMLITVGYDTRKNKYVGSWTGSMMTHLFVYEGWVEEDGRTLVLESTGPSMMDPTKDCTYRDITEFKTDDHRAFRSEMLGDDGKWTQIMSFDMYRVGTKNS